MMMEPDTTVDIDNINNNNANNANNSNNKQHSTSLLPSWVSQFREGIEKSRENYTKTEVVLKRIATNINIINTTIEKGKYTITSNQRLAHHHHHHQQQQQQQQHRPFNFIEVFSTLPCDLLCCILEFNDLLSICQLEKSSSLLYRLLPSNVFFMLLHKLMVNRKQLQAKKDNEDTYDLHQKIMQIFGKQYQCLSYIKKLKNPQQVSRNSGSSGNSGNKKQTTVKIHVVLDILLKVTSNVNDPSINLYLEEGLITVLFQLLTPSSSETGSIKSMACSIIANLIFWQIAICPKNFKSLNRQIESVNGARLLFALLTSPSASVNLAKHTSRIENGSVVLRTTSNVTGVSTRESSRALVNLYCPSHAIGYDSSVDTMISDLFVSVDRPTLWQFRYYHKSGSLKDKFMCFLWITCDGFLFGRGVDGIGTFFLYGRCEPEVSSFSWIFSKSYINNNIESIDIWIADVNPETVQNDHNNNRHKSHVSHTGFFTSNDDYIPDDLYLYEDDDDYLEDCRTRNSGFFGVWERSSSGSHFELDKGGVFRASPMNIEDGWV